MSKVHEQGDKIASAISYSGGLLSAPIIRWATSFSWSSLGALLALKNAARYWEGGKIVEIGSEELMGIAKRWYMSHQKKVVRSVGGI